MRRLRGAFSPLWGFFFGLARGWYGYLPFDCCSGVSMAYFYRLVISVIFLSFSSLSLSETISRPIVWTDTQNGNPYSSPTEACQAVVLGEGWVFESASPASGGSAYTCYYGNASAGVTGAAMWAAIAGCPASATADGFVFTPSPNACLKNVADCPVGTVRQPDGTCKADQCLARKGKGDGTWEFSYIDGSPLATGYQICRPDGCSISVNANFASCFGSVCRQSGTGRFTGYSCDPNATGGDGTPTAPVPGTPNPAGSGGTGSGGSGSGGTGTGSGTGSGSGSGSSGSGGSGGSGSSGTGTGGCASCVPATSGGSGSGVGGSGSGCAAGYVAGEVNGASVCVRSTGSSNGSGGGAGASGTGTTAQKDTKTTTDTTTGNTSTDTTETICKAGNCTTTVTTTVVNQSGTPVGTSTKTSVTDESTFCTQNPQAIICLKGSFTGSCAGGFACDGDPVQCAMAREQHTRFCQLIDNRNNSAVALFDAESVKPVGNVTDSLPGNFTVNIGAQSFDLSNALGVGASCIANRVIVVAGHSVTIPFSDVCQYLAWFGNLLVGVSLLMAARIVMRG